jgi:hypothetical protein
MGCVLMTWMLQVFLGVFKFTHTLCSPRLYQPSTWPAMGPEQRYKKYAFTVPRF